ncbi:hypothetical protein HEB94_001612 [Actinopolymorpha pittospori]|uniref:Transposase DDE domain-containing protein n=1 Tax=Actinopolymorpha pittospori TaxID=648752 RepID=A0A927MQD9_9ACTN|nr:hypothetical protein [Actinopolymorpha pittospori]
MASTTENRAPALMHAPTTAWLPAVHVGLFLRSFAFGHVRQLDAVASRFLRGLAHHTPRLVAGLGDPQARVLVDVDNTIIEVHGYAKQGPGYGYGSAVFDDPNLGHQRGHALGH